MENTQNTSIKACSTIFTHRENVNIHAKKSKKNFEKNEKFRRKVSVAASSVKMGVYPLKNV